MDGPGAEDQHALEPWTAKRAYGLILLLYIVGFGYALASALAYLHEPGHTTGRVGATGALVSTALVLSTDVAVLALVYSSRRRAASAPSTSGSVGRLTRRQHGGTSTSSCCTGWRC